MRLRAARRWLVLLARGLGWRRWSSAVMLAVAAVAVAGGAVGPVFLRSADDSSLVAAVIGSPVASTVTASGQGGTRVWAELRSLGADPPGGSRRHWFGPPQLEGQAGVHLTGRGGTAYLSVLLARSGLCAHVVMTSGHCPEAPGVTALSARSAGALGARVGSTVEALIPGGSSRVDLEVVGIYALPTITTAGFWEDASLFDYGEGVVRPSPLDALLVAPQTVFVANRLGDVPELSVSVRARGAALRAGPLARLRHALEGFRSRAAADGLSTSTGLSGLLAGVRRADRTASTVVEVAAIQLVVLGLLVLYLVEATAAASRRSEAELAARRGFTRLQMALVAVGEPAMLLGAALPVGLLLAWAAVALSGASLFVAGTPVGLPSASLAAGAGVVASGLVAVGVATWDLWRGTGSAARRSSRNRALRSAADVAAVALAAAGLVALSASGSLAGSRASALSLAAPGLLGLGAGVVGLRLGQALLRLATRATARTKRLGLFLAVRSVARSDPSPLRRSLALTAAVVLAAFGVSAWTVAHDNRSRVAGVEVGATEVVDVTTRPGADLSQLVARADPAGRTAMAAEELVSASGDTLAVQASRLAAVAAWPAGLADRPLAELARYLDPPTVPPLRFVGGRLAAEVTLPSGTPPMNLAVTVFNQADQDEDTVELPTFGPGTHLRSVPFDGFCATTCRLVDLSPTLADSAAAAPAVVNLELDRLSAGGGAFDLHSTRAADWSTEPSGIVVHPGARGVGFSIPGDLVSAQGTSLAPADVPSTIPAVATRQALTLGAAGAGGDTFDATGLDGNSITVGARVVATRLPEIGTNAVLVDLRFARLEQSGASEAVKQVWLHGPGAAGVLGRLTRSGVRLEGVSTAASRLGELDRTAVAAAYALVLGAGVAAMLLAFGATCFVLVSGAGKRRAGLHALLVAGADLPVLRRVVAIENAVSLGVPLLVGGVAGYGASALALASLPELVGGSGGVPLVRVVAAGPLLGVVLALALVFSLSTVVATVGVLGASGSGVMRSPK